MISYQLSISFGRDNVAPAVETPEIPTGDKGGLSLSFYLDFRFTEFSTPESTAMESDSPVGPALMSGNTDMANATITHNVGTLVSTSIAQRVIH